MDRYTWRKQREKNVWKRNTAGSNPPLHKMGVIPPSGCIIQSEPLNQTKHFQPPSWPGYISSPFPPPSNLPPPSPSPLTPVPRFLSLLVNSKWRFLYKPFFSFPRRYRLISRPIYTFKVLIRRWLANVSRPISPARRLLVSIFEAVPCNSGGRPGSLSDGRARGIERAPAFLPPLRCSCHQARKIRFDMIRCDPREASHARVCLLWNTVSRLRFLFPSSSPCPSVSLRPRIDPGKWVFEPEHNH